MIYWRNINCFDIRFSLIQISWKYILEIINNIFMSFVLVKIRIQMHANGIHNLVLLFHRTHSAQAIQPIHLFFRYLCFFQFCNEHHLVTLAIPVYQTICYLFSLIINRKHIIKAVKIQSVSDPQTIYSGTPDPCIGILWITNCRK